MGKDRKPLGTVAVVALAAIMLSVVALAVHVDAARGGQGKGNRFEGTNTAPSLTVSPNPVPLGTNITIDGAGFEPNQTVLINTSHYNPEVVADADGSFSFVYDYQYGPGNASVQAYVLQGNDFVMVASASFTICSSDPCPSP